MDRADGLGDGARDADHVTRCYVDTNFVYAHLRDPGGSSGSSVRNWRERVLEEMAEDSGVISAPVIDEVAYRLVLAWLADDGVRDPLSTYRRQPAHTMRAVRSRLEDLWSSIDSLELELEPTSLSTVDRAKMLMGRPGMAPRDAFHAAHAISAGCEAIASADAAFDELSELRRIGPR